MEEANKKIDTRIIRIEAVVENKIKELEVKVQELTSAEEKRQRRERKNNIIIKHAIPEGIEEGSVQEEVNKILKAIEVDVNYEHVRHIGKDWRGHNMVIVKLKDFEDKLKVLRNKKKLIGKECCIENDMTRGERKIQAILRHRAKEEANKGNTVRIGYQKIQINGKWEPYNSEMSKNGHWKEIIAPESQRRRTM